MNQVELTNRLVVCLERHLKAARGHPRQFTPKELAVEIDGAYAPSIGSVADKVVGILRARGWDVRYIKTSTPRKFVMNS